MKYSSKFYFGIVLVVLSLVIGKITTATFIIYRGDSFIRWLSVVIYAISWPMLIIGIWWVGEEYAKAIKRYFSYKFYHEHAKKGGKRVVHHTREGTRKVVAHGIKHGKRVAAGTKKHGKRVVAHGKKIRKNVNNKVKRVNSHLNNKVNNVRKKLPKKR